VTLDFATCGVERPCDTSCLLRVKRRPSVAADLGLFTPQQRISEDPAHFRKVPKGDLSPRYRFSRIRRSKFSALGCLLAQSKLNSLSIFTQCGRLGASLPSSEMKVHVALSNDGADRVLSLVLDEGDILNW
jgi:hypothetical protein